MAAVSDGDRHLSEYKVTNDPAASQIDQSMKDQSSADVSRFETTAELIGTKLENRQDVDDMKQKNIMRTEPTIARSIQAKMKPMEFSTTTVHIKKKIDDRPGMLDVVDQRIIVDGQRVAPRLQADQNNLAYQRTRDSVSQGLRRQPSAGELEDANVLKGSNMATGLVSTSQELEREMKKDKVSRKLGLRPTAEDLAQKNIIPEDGDRAKEERMEARKNLEDEVGSIHARRCAHVS